MSRSTVAQRLALTGFFVVVLLLAPAALAGKGGGGSGGGGKPTGPKPTGSFTLVLVDSTDGVPHYGQRITFNVTSTATYRFVDVDCYQAGTRVYHSGVGFYTGWPWSQNFTLASGAWTGGAADCTARLYATDSSGGNQQTLATMAFAVYA